MSTFLFSMTFEEHVSFAFLFSLVFHLESVLRMLSRSEEDCLSSDLESILNVAFCVSVIKFNILLTIQKVKIPGLL